MIEFRGTAVDVAQAEAPEEAVAASAPTATAEKGEGGGRGEAAPKREKGADGKPGEDAGDAAPAKPEPIKFNNRLGNLVNQVSPLEALGIWPSGDFRLEPGDGAVPAPVFYLGALLGLAALGLGLLRWWSRGETAIPAALAAAVAVYLAARIASTPYTSAKAILMIAPLVTLISVRELLASSAHPVAPRRVLSPLPSALLAIAFVLAAGGSSLLALANAPVGPRDYSDGLVLLRSAVIDERVLVAEPFLLVGIVAAIRRLVVVSAEAKDLIGKPEFGDAMTEIGVLTGTVVVLALAIFLLRNTTRSEPTSEHEPG
jgi:hypothetical protein